MNKKYLFFVLIALTAIVALSGIYWKGKKTLPPNKEEEYIPAEAYRKPHSSEKIIPEAIEVSDADGNVYMLQEYDDMSREMIIGKYGEIGKYPRKVYFIGTDGKKILLESHVYEYDKDGLVISEVCYSDENPYDDVDEKIPVSATEYTYYSGKVANEKEYIYASGKRSVISTYEYVYDNNGYLKKMQVYDGSVPSYYEDITCNTNGSPAVIYQYAYNGTLLGIKEYTYTEDGDILTYKEYTGNREYISTESSYIYDDKDYLRKVITVNYDYEDGNTPEKYEEVYNMIYSERNRNALGKIAEE